MASKRKKKRQAMKLARLALVAQAVQNVVAKKPKLSKRERARIRYEQRVEQDKRETEEWLSLFERVMSSRPRVTLH